METFAHAGVKHSEDLSESIDHCMPIIIGMGAVILILLLVVAYLMTNWEPKNKSVTKSKKLEKTVEPKPRTPKNK